MLAGAALAVVAYGAFCLYGGMMPRCPFKWATGLDCPGCGSQRAFRALLSGHPLEAWGYNLFLPFVMAYLLAILVLPLSKATVARRLYECLTSATAIWILLVLVILWWVVRNLM